MFVFFFFYYVCLRCVLCPLVFFSVCVIICEKEKQRKGVTTTEIKLFTLYKTSFLLFFSSLLT